jgi:hypothetical protein
LFFEDGDEEPDKAVTCFAKDQVKLSNANWSDYQRAEYLDKIKNIYPSIRLN